MPEFGQDNRFHARVRNRGASAIVKARWPRVPVPAPGAHACLTAAVIARGDRPGGGLYVWQDNNLAQKNLTVVEVAFPAGEQGRIPVTIRPREQLSFGLRVSVPAAAPVGKTLRLDLVQRDTRSRRPPGGIAVEIRVI